MLEQKSSDNFTGLKKKQSRRHIYLGRLNENCTEDLIRIWCQKNRSEVHHIREVSKEGSNLRSYHLVFPETAAEFVEKNDFWPENVHGRFYLNEEARNWLQSLPQDEKARFSD